MKKRHITGDNPWDPLVGTTRAIMVGDFIIVSGTYGIDKNGEVVGVGDPYVQTVQAIKNIEEALKEAGAGLSNVIRTRIFVTDMTQWDHVARAHKLFFGAVRPVTTIVEVNQLINEDLFVSIEAEAVILDKDG